jgi:hypothetical protein
LNDMAIRANKDTLLAIWVLAKLGWSSRRIARLILPTSHHTISDYYSEACELIDAGELPITAKDGKRLRITSVGKSSDVEYIEGKVNHGNCGGGRRAKPHIEDDEDWKYKVYNQT